MVTTYSELWTLLSQNADGLIRIVGEVFPDPSIDIVIITYEEEIQEDDQHSLQIRNTSPVIGAFVTSFARKKLLDLIEKIERIRPGRFCYAGMHTIYFVFRF